MHESARNRHGCEGERVSTATQRTCSFQEDKNKTDDLLELGQKVGAPESKRLDCKHTSLMTHKIKANFSFSTFYV